MRQPTKASFKAEFVAILAREIPDLKPHLLRAMASELIRLQARLHKLAEAQCNGDWPADNGERPVMPCPRCEQSWVHSVIKKGKDGQDACPDCRIEDKVRDILKPYNIRPKFSGDPRGCVLKLEMPSGYTNDWGKEGVCVP